MNKVIKDFAKFDDAMQEVIYSALAEGELQRTSFPFRGEISEGVIFEDEENTYLIPTSTIKSRRSASSQDIADEDDDDTADNDDLDNVEIDDADDDLDEE